LRRNHLGIHVFDSPCGNVAKPDRLHTSPGSTVGEQQGVKVQGADKTQHAFHLVPDVSPSTNLPGQHVGAANGSCHLPQEGVSNCCHSLLPPAWFRLSQLRCFAGESFQALACYQSTEAVLSLLSVVPPPIIHDHFEATFCSGFMQHLEGSTFGS